MGADKVYDNSREVLVVSRFLTPASANLLVQS